VEDTFMISAGRLLFSCCLALGFKCIAQQPVSKADHQPYSLLLTTKFHTTGHSPFSGSYFNHHPNGEIGLQFKTKQVGALISKNVDFADVHSPINYTTIGIFKPFRLNESVTLTPYIGFFFKQSHSFMDNNSDAWTCVVARFAINRWLVIENSTLVGNLIRHCSKASLANRLNAVVSIGKFKLDAYAWYTHSFNSASHFVSASLAITSPDWVITQAVSARLQVAVLQQISNEKPEGCMDRGGLISLIIPIDLSTNNDERNSSAIQ
jgi:hypothetical protein